MGSGARGSGCSCADDGRSPQYTWVHVIIGALEPHDGQTAGSSAGYHLTKANGDGPAHKCDAAARQAAQVSYVLLRGASARRVISEDVSELSAAGEDVARMKEARRPAAPAALEAPVR